MFIYVHRHLPVFSLAFLPKPILFGFFIFTLFFGVLFSHPIHAQTSPMPGQTSGTGTHFAITDSLYRNVALDSSQSITVGIQSIPQMVIFTVVRAPSVSAISSQFTISGLLPNTTYYQYRDTYHNLSQETTDNAGSYSFTEDISIPHNFFIQPAKSTLFIRDDLTGGDCTQFGSWNSSTKTCTFTRDATGTIEIDSDNITLDGAGHSLLGTGLVGFGVYLPSRTGVTVKNIFVQQFFAGISLFQSTSSAITANTIGTTSDGILLESSSLNTVSGNLVSGSVTAIAILASAGDSRNNTVQSNTVTNLPSNGGGVFISRSIFSDDNNVVINNTIGDLSAVGFNGIDADGVHGGTISGNKISNVVKGLILSATSTGTVVHDNTIQVADQSQAVDLFLLSADGFTIINNNLLAATRSQQILSDLSGTNVFSQSLPVGGNFWSTYSTPTQGCFDTNNDGICDAPFTFTDIATNQTASDNLPWTREDGWKGTPKMINPTVGGKVVQLFRPTVISRGGIVIRGHSGIDINGTINGAPVFAAAAGTIVQKSNSDGDCGDWFWIFHGDITRLDGATSSKISTTYLHLTSTTPSLNVGGTVIQGQQLGLVDSTGLVTGPHLHFGVRQGDIPSARGCQQADRPGDTTFAVDPLQFVDYQLRLSQALNIVLFSPADIILTDPDGLIVSKQLNQLGSGARYTEVKYLSSTGQNATSVEEEVPEYDSIVVDNRKLGDYLINVVPAPNATPTATYSLVGVSNSTTTVLAASTQIQNIPKQPYIIRSTTSTIEEIVPAKIRIVPETLNFASGGVVTVFIQIPSGFDASIKDIAQDTIRLAGAPPIKPVVISGKNTLIAKFNRRDLQNITVGDRVPIILAAKLKDGVQIEGRDTIRVISGEASAELPFLLANMYAILKQLIETLSRH